jgi:protein-tyrosine phosphatase
LTPDRPNILVICGRNKRRSRTAEYIFKNDSRFQIRSAGLSPQSDVQLNEKLINWADLILVMNNEQRKRIQNRYRSLEIPEIYSLNIADEYEYRDSDLVTMLTTKINETLSTVYDL